MGLVFMGAIVLPAYLVPALTLVLALGLAVEFHAQVASPQPQVRGRSSWPYLVAARGRSSAAVRVSASHRW